MRPLAALLLVALITVAIIAVGWLITRSTAGRVHALKRQVRERDALLTKVTDLLAQADTDPDNINEALRLIFAFTDNKSLEEQ